MEVFGIFLVSLVISLTLADEQNEKSHDIWLTKLEIELNPDWYSDLSYKLKKISKHGKSVYLNVTMHQDVDDAVMCEVKVFQKSGGKYVKAPAGVPPMACCKLMEHNENTIWPCVQKASNFPKNCPLPKGITHLVDFNPGECVYPKNLPPGLSEEYKVIFIGSLNSAELWKYTGYGMVKKRI